MINANELRIGNWVQYAQGQVKRVVGAIGQYDVGLIDGGALDTKQIFPVPLTLEMLESCGFVRYNRGPNGKTWAVVTDNSIMIEIHSGKQGFRLYDSRMNTTIKYLHQLQNLYFALTGEELKVNFNERAMQKYDIAFKNGTCTCKYCHDTEYMQWPIMADEIHKIEIFMNKFTEKHKWCKIDYQKERN